MRVKIVVEKSRADLFVQLRVVVLCVTRCKKFGPKREEIKNAV